MYDQIQALCRQNATNITAMCRELGIPRSTLSELRAGRTKELSLQNLRRIAEYFSVPVDSLSHPPQQQEALAVFPPPDDFFTTLYLEAQPLNEENRKKLLDLAHILRLAQQCRSGSSD